MRAWCAVLLMFAACGSEKSAPAPPETLPTTDEVDVPPPTTGEKEQKEPEEAKKPEQLWDPPADLGHLEDTAPDLRKRIDDFITTMIDIYAGRNSLDAKEALIAIGKPAFPRILGAMAKIRDTITDVDSDDERLIESSLKLADECLREMDGYLTAKGKSTLRPGSEKLYIAYICRLHYKRWTQKLQHMDELPGPYDPSAEWEDEWKRDVAIKRAEMVEKQLTQFLEGKATTWSTLRVLFDAGERAIDVLKAQAWTLVEKIPARIKKERESWKEFGPLFVRELNHDDVRLRTLARDCLRVLYDKTIHYDPKAPPSRRKEKMKRWHEVIEAADK